MFQPMVQSLILDDDIRLDIKLVKEHVNYLTSVMGRELVYSKWHGRWRAERAL